MNEAWKPESEPKPTNAQRAKILVEALPYIRKYTGKIVVVKYGGAAMWSEGLPKSVMRDIVLLSLIGVKVVLVHGGGPEISSMLEAARQKERVCERSARHRRGNRRRGADGSRRERSPKIL
jgi:hypothetical protein